MADYDLLHDGEEIDACIDEVVAARGSEASLSAGIAAAVSTAVSAEETSRKAECGAIANDGAKNKFAYLNYTAGQTATVSGRKFTMLSDGGIKIENAHSGTGNYADLYLSGTWAGTSAVFYCEGATYRASIQAPDVASGSKQYVIFKLYDRHTGATVEYIDPSAASDGADFSFDATVAYISIHKNLSIPSGGIIVYPMIRREEISDSSFQPYAPTNRELYEMILALQSGRSVQSVAQLNRSEQIDPDITLDDPEESEER